MTNVALVDIRHVDGEPHDVAQIAGEQVLRCFALLSEAFTDFEWAARGSWLSQEHHREGRMPDADEFVACPLGRNLAAVRAKMAEAAKTTRVATVSASFDPRSH